MLQLRAGRALAVAGTVVVAGLTAAAPATAASRCADADVVPTAKNGAQVAKALVCLINEKRTASGLRRIKANGKLTRAARKHSRDMVQRHYFAHISGGGKTHIDRARAAGYLKRARAWWLGENIAWGHGSQASAKHILKTWMNSAPHRANMLSRDAKDGGIGIAPGTPTGARGATYTLMVGKRR